MNQKYVVFGAGQIGTLVARQLAAGGSAVTVVSRRPRADKRAGIEHVARDVMTDPLDDVTAGASAVFVALNVDYDHKLWARTLPLMNRRVADAAKHTRLVVLENLYVYGASQAHLPLRADMPLAPSSIKGEVRAQIARDLFAPARIEAQLVTSVRPPDFWGPGLTSALLDDKALRGLVLGKKPLAMGDPNALHARAYVNDVAAAMVALAHADESVFGRPWHPPVIHVSTCDLVAAIASAAGVADPGVRVLPRFAVNALAKVVPLVSELHEMAYLWDRPHLVDDAEFRLRFGLAPTPLADGARACAAFAQSAQARAA
ncbi:MAG TPA: NAD-dependent epimerase/dehydratase family protein [Myxococcota bacterium]|jgi:nucleoside-diphosphate-sugar epimerase